METDKKKAKFELQDLMGIAVIIIVFGIVVVFGVQMQSDVRSDINNDCPSGMVRNETYVADSASACNVPEVVGLAGANISQITAVDAYNAGTDSIEATGKLASKQGIIVTAVVAVVIIGLLYKLFAFSQSR